MIYSNLLIVMWLCSLKKLFLLMHCSYAIDNCGTGCRLSVHRGCIVAKW